MTNGPRRKDALVLDRRDDLYWDPMPHITPDVREQTFGGKWEERNWRNVPGPLYGAMTDNCWVGRLRAPRHILYGDDDAYEQEFLYRQPTNLADLRCVLMGMSEDPWVGWACDGDSHWTPALVREWWRDRPRLLAWITEKHKEWSESTEGQEREAATGLTDYRAYIEGDLAEHLRCYSYFLDQGVSPRPGDRLPSLDS
jgi:hypothetical protein